MKTILYIPVDSPKLEKFSENKLCEVVPIYKLNIMLKGKPFTIFSRKKDSINRGSKNILEEIDVFGE